MRNRILVFTLLVLVAAGLVALAACRKEEGKSPAAGKAAAAKQWQCPMHPQIIQDRPGECPICGMDLVEVESTEAAPAATTQEVAADRWQCPMHPEIIQDRPGDCPICGMDLVKVEPAPESAPSGTNAPKGLTTVTIDPAKQQLIGLRVGMVERKPLAGSIRTVGRVTFDETRVHHIHTKYEAYVEHVHPNANFIGAKVSKGEPLVTLYSPELYATQQEYLLALKAQRRLGETGAPGVARQGNDLLEAARQRLLLWDLPASEIERLEKSGEASRTFHLFAPVSGFVTGKTATHGMKVTPADSLFDIADLSRVWVLADVYEAELPRIAVGQKATMSLSYWPGKSWTGKVTYVFPTVDEKTRTVKVRVEFDNPGHELKPEMFADVVLHGQARTALVVPEDAVIESGTRSVVFVVHGGGKLEPREIGTGQSAEGLVEVLDGLHEKEAIALGASFLIDSESRLKAALQAYTSSASAPSTASPHAGHAPEPKK